MNMKYLENCFRRAKELDMKYVAITVQMEGIPTDEILINPLVNIDAKLEYFKKAYDDNLRHKHANGRITGFTFGESFEQIEEDFFGL